MNTLDAIFSRKSVRNYTGEKITEDELAIILKSAFAAPVGLGQYENVHITVIENREILNAIDENCAEMFGKPDMHPLYGAPMLVLISAKMPPVNTSENVVYSNAACIAENMALAATELGVGVCHIWGAVAALSKSASITEKLEIPEGFIPCCAVTLGKTEYVYENREIPQDKISVRRYK